MARLLNRLLLIALAKGKLPMNGYAVVKEQAKGIVQKEHLSPIVLKPWGCQPCSAKNFFLFFDGEVQRLSYRLMACPLQPADLPGGQATKHMKPKTPFLDFCKYARSE